MIQNWFDQGKMTCPVSGEPIPNQRLTPNRNVRQLIKEWSQTVDNYRYSENMHGVASRTGRQILCSLLGKLSSELISEQREAALKLSFLTEKEISACRFLAESQTYVTDLINPLLKRGGSDGQIDLVVQQNLMAAIFYITSYQYNLMAVGETPMLASALAEGLTSGTMETKKMVFGIISSLAEWESVSILTCGQGILELLFSILNQKDDTSSPVWGMTVEALNKVCDIRQNRDRAVSMVSMMQIWENLMGRANVEGISSLLATLSKNEAAAIAIHDNQGLTTLFQIIKETESPQTKDNCLQILFNVYHVCQAPSQLKKLRKKEKSTNVLSDAAKDGSDTAKWMLRLVKHAKGARSLY